MYKDLFKSMRLGAILGLISNIIQDVSAVFIATVLGTFTICSIEFRYKNDEIFNI